MSQRRNPTTCDHTYPNGNLAVAQVDLDRICVLCLLETCSHCRRVLDDAHDISPCPNKHRNPNRPEWMNK